MSNKYEELLTFLTKFVSPSYRSKITIKKNTEKTAKLYGLVCYKTALIHNMKSIRNHVKSVFQLNIFLSKLIISNQCL